jgi:hypothetical protein
MDRYALQRHWAEAEQRVWRGQQNVNRQRRIIAELERDGHDANQARQLLSTIETTLRLHIEDRDQVANRLARLES